MSDPLDAVKPESPWEDTLILAFRDIQWVLHNEERESLILESCTGLIPEKITLQTRVILQFYCPCIKLPWNP